MNCEKCSKFLNCIRNFQATEDYALYQNDFEDCFKEFLNPNLSTGLSTDMTNMNMNVLNDDIEVILDVNEDKNELSKEDVKLEHKNKIKMIDSILERNIEEKIFKCDNIKNCLISIKMIDVTIKTLHKKVLYHYAELGNLLLSLKGFEKTKFDKLLVQNKINYSKQHISSLIKIYNLCSQHPTLLRTSLSLYFILKNFNIIKDLCEEMEW